jgi:hypothetical protein
MAFVNPEILALGRVSFVFTDGTITDATYEFSNGFDAVEVPGALPGASPIFVDTRYLNPNPIVLFLSEPAQPGNAAPGTSQAGIKATFDIVTVSTPTDPLPIYNFPFNIVNWQYGDYSLAGTAYEGVNPQKGLRFNIYPFFEGAVSLKVDVSVLKNPMTLYK